MEKMKGYKNCESLSSEDAEIVARYFEIVCPESDEVPEIRRFVQEEVDSLFFKGDGEYRSLRAIRSNIAVYVSAVREKVKQLEGMVDGDNDFDKRRARNKKNFERAPRTLYKTLQEIFTAEGERQNFKRGERGDVVIDPRKITDDMLKAFGLEAYVPSGGKPVDKVAERGQAIPAIKQFFEESVEPLVYDHEKHLRPHEGKFFRAMKITNGKNRGRILVVQESSGKHTIFSTGLHEAARRIEHIDQSYREERENLYRIRDILRGITVKVLVGWEHVRDEGELENIKKELCDIVDNLKHVRDVHKVSMRERITKCLTFSDAKGRLNPGSRLAILNSVKKYIGRRIKAGADIMGHLSGDGVRIESLINQQSGSLRGFYESVEKSRDKIFLLDPKKKIEEEQMEKIVLNLDTLKFRCRSFGFHPYLGLGESLNSDIDKILPVLKSSERNDISMREQCKESFVRIYVVSKILKLENDLLKLKSDFFPINNQRRVYMKGIAGRTEAILKDFSNKRVAPEVDIKEFNEFCGGVYKFLGEIVTIARRSISNRVPPKERLQKRMEAEKEIYARLSTINFPEIYGKVSSVK